MKKVIFLLIFLIFFVDIGFSLPVKTDFVKYIGKELSLTWAYSEYEICNPINLDFKIITKSKDYFNWYFNNITGNLLDSWLEIRKNETYLDQKWIENIICKNENINGTIEKVCYDNGYYKDVLKWHWVWHEFQIIDFIFPKQTCYNIRIYGKFKPAYKENNISIDNIIEFAGFSFEEHDWWDITFGKRVNITINNTGNSNILLNYQIKMNITYDSDMQSDFRDLRFIDSDDLTELNYFIEFQNDSNWAFVWVKIPSIPAFDSKDIFVYYNNLDVSSLSNPYGVFLEYNDFTNDVSLNTTLFKKMYNSNNPTFSNGYGMTCGNVCWIKSIKNYTDNFVVDMNLSLSTVINFAWIGSGIDNWINLGGGSQHFAFFMTENTNPDINIARTENITTRQNTNMSGNFSYNIKSIYYNKSEVNFVINYDKWFANHTSGIAQDLTSTAWVNHLAGATDGLVNVSWWHVREYAKPEPTITIKGEEEPPKPPNIINYPLIVCFKIKPLCIKLSDYSIYLLKENSLIEWFK